jgi:hypothetical protein
MRERKIMVKSVEQNAETHGNLKAKFFIIVDGEEGLCLVGVDPPTVHYLIRDEIKLAKQHLDVTDDQFSPELIALRLSAEWGNSEFNASIIAWMKEIRAKNSDGSFGSGQKNLVNACLSGLPPMNLLVGRGKRG